MKDRFSDPIPGKEPEYKYPGVLSTEIFSIEKSKEEYDFIDGMKEMLEPLKKIKEFKIIVIEK